VLDGVTTTMPYTLVASECKINKNFKFNIDRFNITHGKKYFDQYYDLCYSRETKDPSIYDGTYRTRFGPCFANSGVVYGNTPMNLGLSLRRYTSIREPQKIGYDKQLRLNQQKFLKKNFYPLNKLRCVISKHMKKNMTLYNELNEIEILCNQPHSKKKLRQMAFKELGWSCSFFNKVWHNDVTGKMKKDEIAKSGKLPRIIGDLTVINSLQGAIITKHMKTAMYETPLELPNITIEFCMYPRPSDLTKVFNNIIKPNKKYYFVYFSDDACFAVKKDDGTIDMYNLDISSCDTSHTPELFYKLGWLLPREYKKRFKTVIDQCNRRLVIPHPKNKRNKKKYKNVKVVLDFLEPALMSGSTLTTLINNLANICNAISISQSDDYDFIKSCEKAGYIVTLDKCSTYHHLQFLKHSPVYDISGQLRPVLNLGVIMKSFGECHGDLPGKRTHSLEQRSKIFLSNTIESYKSGTQHSLITTLTKKYYLKKYINTKILNKIYKDNYLLDNSLTSEPYIIDDNELIERYRQVANGFDLQISDYYITLEYINESSFGSTINSKFIYNVMEKDYSLGSIPLNYINNSKDFISSTRRIKRADPDAYWIN
jgi:hypothetical protein